MAVHMVHVYHPDWDHWGRWLVWGSGTDTPYATPRCYLWTPPRENEPGNGTFQTIPNNRTNLFCCGHCPLADGRVLTAGGQFQGSQAPKHTDIFTPTSTGGSWSDGHDMTYRRWYPTCTRMPDGKALITSGEMALPFGTIAKVMELFNPATGQVLPFSGSGRELDVPSYPFVHVIDEVIDGQPTRWRVVYAGGEQRARRIIGAPNMNDWGNWEEPSGLYNWGHAERKDATSVLQSIIGDPQQVLKFGGLRGLDDLRATRAISRLLQRTGGYVWERIAALNKPRINANSLALPDRRIAVIGGNNREEPATQPPWAAPVLTAEFIDPRQPPAGGLLWPETEGTMAGEDGRTYHSTAGLLPDSRAIVAGGEPNRRDAQFLKPPYLAATVWPMITQANAGQHDLVYNTTFEIEFAFDGVSEEGHIDRVVLMGLNAVTHGFDQNQRYLELEIVSRVGSNRLVVRAPVNARLAPPGWYMLFVVADTNVPAGASGVPCRNARYVLVRA
ncbi:MAG: DUF1929 domain-containing protein [Phycisphaerae bacterium]|nr:DUF1929 domain-containing protein [Phycisphaerae bacterium]